MDIGIRLHDTAGTTLKEHLRCAKEQGFTCVHLALGKLIPGFKMADAPALLTDELAEEIRKELARNGQTCVLLGCYLNLCSPDLEAHAKTLEIYKAHLRFAKKIGALLVGTETGAPNEQYKTCPECFTEESLRLFIDRVTPVVRYAEEVEQLFAIEPVARHIVSTPERCRRVLDAVNSPNLRVILDAVNLLSEDNYGEREAIIRRSIALLGDRVSLLHMKDALLLLSDAEGSSKLQSIACGLGEMDYRPLLALAKKKHLPMTLEDTTPANAVSAREYLADLGKELT